MLKPGDHLCLFYDDDPAEQMAALVPFMRQGLEGGERCIYIADDQTESEVLECLEASGVDVLLESSRGALLLWTRDQWRLPGELNSGKKAEQVRGVIDAALAAGFSGIRFAVEMTWTLGPDVDVELLRHWEATINTIFKPDVPARIICQYSRKRLSTDAIAAALTTHPLAVIGSEVYPNQYYEAPLILADNDAHKARTDWMISQLRWARAFETEREQRASTEEHLQEVQRAKEQVEELCALAESRAEELRKASAVKDEFLGLVSHELRTPITVILGNAHVLLKTLTPVSEEHQRALLDVRFEAERLNRIVSNLLVLAKLEGGQKLDLDPILIAPIVERVVNEHTRRYPQRAINIQCQDKGTPILGNEVYTDQVLSNLVSNAEKYSPPDAAIDIQLTNSNGDQIVRVMDRGIGLAADDASQVFEPFYRTDKATQVSPGIGIGLAVCKRLIEAQDGRVWAKPRKDGGAEFGFALKTCAAYD
jgi:signal transduction histidine kinase